jgi:CRISPR-associated exonuclease Cas4
MCPSSSGECLDRFRTHTKWRPLPQTRSCTPQYNFGRKQKLSGLRLVCHALCIQGVADLVEFRADGTPFPVEYKRGKDHEWDNDNVQLCAQALCLEEMTGLTVPAGAIYHIRSKRRRPVDFTPELRLLTTQTILKVRELLNKTSLPPPVHVPHCKKCSLFNLCLPKLQPSQPKYRQLADDLFNP